MNYLWDRVRARSHDRGEMAQLVAHLHGMQEVQGSSPCLSTEIGTLWLFERNKVPGMPVVTTGLA
jgi:hypothetical protein